jgi:hypothetical protein
VLLDIETSRGIRRFAYSGHAYCTWGRNSNVKSFRSDHRLSTHIALHVGVFLLIVAVLMVVAYVLPPPAASVMFWAAPAFGFYLVDRV